MVFQKPTPFPMTIYDNIAFGVRLFENLGATDMDERVEWALRKSALWTEVKDKLHQSGSSLSGGQQQRLCIARGIAIKPEVLLLDEPCSALDPISTAKVEELIVELKNDYTVVIVTHNMQQAARVSDFTAYMYLGELIEFGVTDQLFLKPRRKRFREGAAQGHAGLEPAVEFAQGEAQRDLPLVHLAQAPREQHQQHHACFHASPRAEPGFRPQHHA